MCMLNFIRSAFSPLDPERTPDAIDQQYGGGRSYMVRGNVYARLNGTLSDSEHEAYMREARHPITMDEVEKNRKR